MHVASDHIEDDHRGLRLAWAVTNLPAVGLLVAGGMLHAFARATTTAPMPAAERRRIVGTARRVAGGAR